MEHINIQTLNEVKRIHELMSVNKNLDGLLIIENKLLTEQTGFMDELIDKVTRNMDEFMGYVTKPKDIESIISALKQSFRSEMKSVDSWDTLKLVYRELSQPLQRRLIFYIIKLQNGSLDIQITNSIAKQFYPNLSAEEALKEFEKFAKDKTYFKDTDIEKFLEFLTNDPDEKITLRAWATRYFKSVRNIRNVLSEIDINNYVRIVMQKRAPYWVGEVTRAWRTSMEEITNNITKLNDEYTSILKSGDYDQALLETKRTAYAAAIVREMNKAEIKLKSQAKKIFNSQVSNPDLRNRIENSSEDFFTIFKKYHDGAEAKWYRDIIDGFKGFFKDFFGTKKIGKLAIPFPTKDAWQYIFTGQWAKFSSYYHLAIKYSSGGWKEFKLVGTNKYIPYPAFIEFISRYMAKTMLGGIIAGAAYVIFITLDQRDIVGRAINNLLGLTGNEPIIEVNDDEYKTAFAGLWHSIKENTKKVYGDYYTPLVPFVGSFNHAIGLRFVFVTIMGYDEPGISITGLAEWLMGPELKEKSGDKELEDIINSGKGIEPVKSSGTNQKQL
jgi:hypothetical protein